MVNYQNGKIYTLRSRNSDKIYIGSTCQDLSKRLYGHKKGYKKFMKTKLKYVSSYEVIEGGNVFIELLESYPCNSSEELRRREGQLQREVKCVNQNIAGRTRKEYRQDNKEAISAKKKVYCQENKEAILAKKKVYHQENKEAILAKKKVYRQKNKEAISNQKNIKVHCECGSISNNRNIRQHERSQKHEAYVLDNFGVEGIDFIIPA